MKNGIVQIQPPPYPLLVETFFFFPKLISSEVSHQIKREIQKCFDLWKNLRNKLIQCQGEYFKENILSRIHFCLDKRNFSFDTFLFPSYFEMFYFFILLFGGFFGGGFLDHINTVNFGVEVDHLSLKRSLQN